MSNNILISHPAAFGGRSWTQVVLVASTFYNHSAGAGSGFFSIVGMDSDDKCSFLTLLNFSLDAHLLILEHSLELLSDQVLDIVKQLNVLSAVVNSNVDLDIILDVPDAHSAPFFSVANDASVLSSSGIRVLIFKIGSLESKLVALEASVGSVLGKLDLLCASSGF
ncbi:hypothetical protein G9A89_018447 [Geosiphon pyriformis]|nr:hypothetical protein G9A89_018447 [Geosiphon pyriformis]